MKKFHRKAIERQARKFNKLLKYVTLVKLASYDEDFVKRYNGSVFPNGLNPNAVAKNSRFLKDATKAKIVREHVFGNQQLHAPHYKFKDSIFKEVTGLDASTKRHYILDW